MESDDESLPEPPKTEFKDNKLRNTLLGLSLGEENVEFILENGIKYIDKPKILDIKLGIGPVKAEKVIEILRMSQQQQQKKIYHERH